MKWASEDGQRHRMRRETNGGEAVLTGALRGAPGAGETLEYFGRSLLLGGPDRRIGEALCKLRQSGKPVNVLTLLLKLSDAGELNDRILRRLSELLEDQGTGPVGESVQDLLAETATMERLARVSKQVSKRARDAAPGEGTEVVGEARRALDEIETKLRSDRDSEGVLVSLREIQENPEMHQPPATVVNRMAWAGRVSLLAGREKLGKSTIICAAAAAASKGEPLFDVAPDRHGTVLYVGLEEALADTGRRLLRWGAAPDRVVFARPHHVAPFDRLERSIEEAEPVLVLVDSLAAFTQRLNLDPGNSAQWTRVMSRFTSLAREANAGLVLVHHARKRDGRYRDSSAIGAGVDMILEMSRGKEENERDISARGRWTLEDYSFALCQSGDEPRYELTSEDISLERRIVRYVRRNPGCSSRSVREGVRGKNDEVANVLGRLEDRGKLANQGSGNRHEWHPPGR